MPQRNYFGYGLLWRESSSGKIHNSGIIYDNNGAGVSQPNYYDRKYTTATAISASYGAYILADGFKWFRIKDDNTNRIAQISIDGQNWIQAFSVGRTDFITANQVGFWIYPRDVGSPHLAMGITVRSWLES